MESAEPPSSPSEHARWKDRRGAAETRPLDRVLVRPNAGQLMRSSGFWVRQIPCRALGPGIPGMSYNNRRSSGDLVARARTRRGDPMSPNDSFSTPVEGNAASSKRSIHSID